MSAQHIEKWPEFDDHPSYGKRLAFGNDAVILNRSQYSHAKLCVDACEGITDKDLHALKGTNILQKANHSVDEMQQQNAELKEQSSRLAAEAVRQAQQNADLCVKNAELLTIIKWANNHGGLGYSIHAEFEKAIAKAGDNT